MNRTFTINMLSDRIALMTGHPTETCQKFVSEAFALIADGLRMSGYAKIKYLGEFRGSDGGVIFIPEPAVADRVNEPFSFFEATEIEEFITEEMLAEEPDDNIAEATATQDDRLPEPLPAVDEAQEKAVDAEVENAVTNDANLKETIPLTSETTETTEEEIIQPVAADTPAEEISAYVYEDADATTEPTPGAELPKQEISIRGYGLEITPEINVEQQETDSRMRLTMFLFGLALGLVIGASAVYFLS